MQTNKHSKIKVVVKSGHEFWICIDYTIIDRKSSYETAKESAVALKHKLDTDLGRSVQVEWVPEYAGDHYETTKGSFQ